MRNRNGGLAVSPVLVGAVTVLVAIVAVFLAYNANNGLPFVSTYDLKARLPDADALVKANEVRIGGARVGVIKSVVPVQLKNGAVEAEVTLSLDKSAEPIPDNSMILVRPKSPLGLKYLQITPGNSTVGFKAGETIPVRYATPEPGDIDKFFDMFDAPTRKAIQRSTAGFGNALAGRGPQLNEAIGALRGLVEEGEPAAALLAAPSTNFGGFFRALEALSATVAPVAQQQASMFVVLDQTFAAFAHVSRPYIQETIEKSPPTLDTVNAGLPKINPFLRDTARFFTAFRPGARALEKTSPVIAESLRAGVPALNATPVLNNQLPPLAEALLAFQEAEGTMSGLQLLTDLNENLEPPLRFITPAQTTCNYFSLTFKQLSSASGQGNQYGKWLNFISFPPPEGPNSESGQAAAPADGEQNNHLHYNPLPNTAAPGQTRGCEAGNEKYVAGQTVIGEAPETFSSETEGVSQQSGGSETEVSSE
ncbi:MAG TPA: MlaD family protein [Solirubrobacterales bacterium]|nr:MlaD family protein [Solirubrobacterales bacterium]